MADTYTQIHIQLVFAVKGRSNMIQSSWEEELYQYITGIIQNNGHKLLAINGMPDHIHIFIGYRVSQPLPKLVETIKTDSNRFIKQKKFTQGQFAWQSGYGAFSYSRSQVNDVVRYVMNQKEHHSKTSFREEYVKMLNVFEVEYKKEFLFDFEG